jgi:hypothetical protein
VAFLEAELLALREEKQDLKAELGLHEENKELTTKVNKATVDDLKAERNCLVLSNYSLDYNHRQTQLVLSEEREKAASELSFRDSQITLLNVDMQASKWKIEELEAKVSHLSEASSRQGEMYAKEQKLAEAQVKIEELESS